MDEANWENFFECGLQEWICLNLNDIKDHKWSNTWTTTCHMLWYSRNQRKYNADYIMPTNLVTEIRRKIMAYKDSISIMQKVHQKREVIKLISWHPPNADWLALNTDGAVKSNLYAGCEGVLRDNRGLWCGGFFHNTGPTYVIEAELKLI